MRVLTPFESVYVRQAPSHHLPPEISLDSERPDLVQIESVEFMDFGRLTRGIIAFCGRINVAENRLDEAESCWLKNCTSQRILLLFK